MNWNNNGTWRIVVLDFYEFRNSGDIHDKYCQEKYRLRYGQYRILYFIQDKELSIWIVKVGHRKNVYG